MYREPIRIQIYTDDPYRICIEFCIALDFGLLIKHDIVQVKVEKDKEND